MGKINRHQKNLRSEKAKVKLRAKKSSKPLPKGLNVTDTTFKVKKIVVREQLKQHEESEILCRKMLNVKDLLSRLQHHNSSVRQEAVRSLKEMLSQHSTEILSSHLHSLLQGIAALTLDRDRDIRRDSLKVLSSILGPISNDQLRPFSDVLISYLRCAMTHIDPNIKEDSLLFLDVLGLNCGVLLAKNARKVLPNFLEMISKLRSESQPGRQLVTSLNSKNTSAKWRTKVLGRLSSFLSAIVSERKSRRNHDRYSKHRRIVVDLHTRFVPIYKSNNLDICSIDWDGFGGPIGKTGERTSEIEELANYSEILIPLMIDSWLEVAPKQKSSVPCDRAISTEAANLLKYICEVIGLLIEYFELLGCEKDAWMRQKFLDSFGRNFLEYFPYSITRNVQRPRKRRQETEFVELNDKCLEQNLVLCHAYLWMLTADKGPGIEEKACGEICTRILLYVNETLRSISSNDVATISHLSKLLRVIFIRGSKMFSRSGVSLGETLSSVIEAHARGPRRELQSQLCVLLTQIVMNHELRELHKEKAFKKFVSSLPALLLKNSIHENTIVMINRVVLRYSSWINEDLASKQNEIIENAAKIDIIGSEDDRSSRLMICNLLYFVDGHVYC